MFVASYYSCSFHKENEYELKEYINDSMRSIRKVQSDCEIMDICVNKPELLDEIHDGVVFDRMVRSNGLTTYMVYLDKLKIMSKITSADILEDHSEHKFKLYYFGDEYNKKKRVRLKNEIL